MHTYLRYANGAWTLDFDSPETYWKVTFGMVNAPAARPRQLLTCRRGCFPTAATGRADEEAGEGPPRRQGVLGFSVRAHDFARRKLPAAGRRAVERRRNPIAVSIAERTRSLLALSTTIAEAGTP